MNMSSKSLENSATGSPAQRILNELKMKGPQTAGELGKSLGVTGEAARLQLVRLAEQGLVEAASEAHGVGRPSQKWRLKALAHSVFPDAHDELAVQLIEHIRRTLGEEALNKVIAARDEVLRTGYREEMQGASSLRERVRRLAAIRDREGYMCEWRAEGKEYVLTENHCPICAVATACQGFCQTELQTFKSVLGPGADVRREEHLMNGDRRCTYRITTRRGRQE
jgi:predicted ArsR family transcriptional regulator